jgi:hypothetical protein
LTVIAVCVGLLWLGEAHAARFQDHDTNSAVPVGTVYDITTNLLWEKKGVSTYNWSTSGSRVQDGTAFTSFLASLNGGNYYDPSVELVVNSNATTTSCFANRCDWRLPEINELKGIRDVFVDGCGHGDPCIDPIFGPTFSEPYWSATTFAGDLRRAWFVNFNGGGVSFDFKTNNAHVRAVRSGL